MSNFVNVHPEAKIASNVEIGSFTTIYKDVEIGEGTWIGPNVTIMDGARIGKNCRIFPGAVISAIPQDLKFKGEITTLEIGDNTTVRECCTLNRGTASKGKTVIGSNNLLMAYVHVGHDCIIGNNIILGNGVQVAGEVKIDDHAIISAHSLIHQFSNIGAHVMISGGSLIRKDVPPFTLAAHEPLAFVGLNVVGLRRRGFSSDIIREIQEIYKIIYQGDLNHSHAIAKITEDFKDSAHRNEIVNFIKSSKRGIMKGYTGKSQDVEF